MTDLAVFAERTAAASPALATGRRGSVGLWRSQAEEAMAVPGCAGHRLGDLRQAGIGLAIPGEAFLQNHHAFELPVPLADEQRPRSEAGPIPRCRQPRFERTRVCRFGPLASRLAKNAQRLLIETAERGGLKAIGQDPQEQPPGQMGGRGPAQVIAPLQTKPVRAEIDEARDCLIQRCDAVGPLSHARQTLAEAARSSGLDHQAARLDRAFERLRALMGTRLAVRPGAQWVHRRVRP